jgi:hypothetical protein
MQLTTKKIVSTIFKITIIAGISIFALGLFYTLQKSVAKSNSKYFEYQWNQREIVDTLLKQYAEQLSQKDSLSQLADFTRKHKKSKKKFSFHAPQKLKKNLASIVQAQQRLALMNDTIFVKNYFDKRIHINTKLYSRETLIKKQIDSSCTFICVPIILVDSTLPQKRIDGWYNVKTVIQADSSAFYLHNPNFGLWLVLLLLEISLAILCIPLQVYYLFWVTPRYVEDNEIDFSFLSSAFVFAFVALFCMVFFNSFIFKNHTGFLPFDWFQSSSSSVFESINYIGYFAGALSLTGFIKCVLQANKIRLLVRKPKVSLLTMQESFQEIKQNLRIYFVVALFQILLSTLSILALVYSINNLPIVNAFSKIDGNELISYKVVCLYGLMHFLVVLVFYVVARQIIISVPEKYKIIVEY